MPGGVRRLRAKRLKSAGGNRARNVSDTHRFPDHLPLAAHDSPAGHWDDRVHVPVFRPDSPIRQKHSPLNMCFSRHGRPVGELVHVYSAEHSPLPKHTSWNSPLRGGGKAGGGCGGGQVDSDFAMRYILFLATLHSAQVWAPVRVSCAHTSPRGHALSEVHDAPRLGMHLHCGSDEMHGSLSNMRHLVPRRQADRGVHSSCDLRRSRGAGELDGEGAGVRLPPQ